METLILILIKARDEASAVLRSLASNAGSLASALPAIASAAGPVGIAVGAVITGITAMEVVTAKLTGLVTNLERVASASGTTVPRVQMLREAFENAGLGAESADRALMFMARAMDVHRDALRAMSPAARDAFEMIIGLADAYNKSTNAAEKQTIAVALFGRGGRESAGMMKTLVASLNEVNDIMNKTGAYFDDLAINKMGKTRAELNKLRIEWNTAWHEMTIALMPLATFLLNRITDDLNFILAIMRFLHLAAPAVAKGMGQSVPDITGKGLPNLAGPSDYAKAVAELARVMGITTVAAAALYKQLERIDQLAKKSATEKKLKDFFTVEGIESEAEKLLTPRKAISEFIDALNKLRTAGQITKTALEAIYAGMEAAFSKVANAMFQKGQTIGGAIKTFFATLGQEIVNMVTKLLADYAVIFLLKLLGHLIGGPIGAFLTGASQITQGVGVTGVDYGGNNRAGLATPSVAGGTFGDGNRVGRAAPSAAGGNTFHIHTYDARDLIQQLTAPDASMRRAFDHVYIMGQFA